MNTQSAYDLWSAQYDTNENKTRDLEGKALREVLSSYSFNNVLEIGCGTGKNTQYLLEKAAHHRGGSF
ncbi:MAG TPA: class I SAM-dependent methyltransferase [Sphingobacteriaceae bacterium]